jgi:alpha-ketoglutarate-dependent taurine dioxygenase
MIKNTIIFLCHISLLLSYQILQHPLEKRIAYVYGIKDVKQINEKITQELIEKFKKHPLLIFKGVENVSPKEFIDFVKQFDANRDENALENTEDNQHQILQPFDQFPDCPHVAPRGNVELLNFHDIKNIAIKPNDAFVNNYLWHTDILGHEYKLPNVVTGFYIIEQPLIGGDTDFISGETVYENLNKEEKIASQNMLLQINRRKFITKNIEIDYAGVNRMEPFDIYEDGNTKIPLVYAPDNNNEIPRVLLTPTFFERIVGWNVKESRIWMKYFMNNKVLPYRVSVQWKKGDLAVLNNRRFIHSSTPARNYLDNSDSSKRLLLQTFIPTNQPLLSIKPSEKNVYACYNLKWITNQEKSIISAHNNIKFATNISIKNNDTSNNNYYVLCKKINN